MSLKSVQSFVIDNCNGPPIENGLNNVCLNRLSHTFTFITVKHVTSGGIHLYACASQFGISKKQRRNGGEPPTSIAMSLPLRKAVGKIKASLNLNFYMFCAIIKAILKTKGLFIVYKYHNQV